MVALTARCARAIDEGEPLARAAAPPDRGEHLARDPHGLSGELIDLERGDVLPARARVERLVEWVLPVADEIGATPWLKLPEQNAAERQIARRAEGASFEEIYAEQVGVTIPRGLTRERAAAQETAASCIILAR